MLLKNYEKHGLLFITSVLGATGQTGVWAFRGDLVLIEGSFREGSATDRKPPELLLHQAAILADEQKFLFVSGLFYELSDTAVFAEKYREALSEDTVTLFYVENISLPMQVTLNGTTFRFLPYLGGMVWNESMELLYIEKADLKGLSAEDKIACVYEAAKTYKAKGETLTYAEALTKTITVRKTAAVGPV